MPGTNGTNEAAVPESDLRLLSNLRTLQNILVQRAQFAAQAGVTFDGGRDLYSALGYKRSLTPKDYRERYRRNGVAARIVEALPTSTWRHGGELIEDEDPNVITAFEQAWIDLNLRLRIWQKFKAADVLCGLGRYAVILIGAPGKFDQPLERVKPQDLRYLQPFGEEDVTITKYDAGDESERYGQPHEYTLKRQMIQGTTYQPPTTVQGRTVHWTRVLHVADGVLDDSVFGLCRMERGWNLLDDLEKVSGGGAEAFWRRADAGMQLKLDPSFKADPKHPDELEKVKEQIDEYINGLRRVLTTRGVDINQLSSAVADFSSPVGAIFDQLAASYGIPKRILMGSERGELASSQDQDNYAERVSDRRNDFAAPQVVRQGVDRFIKIGVLPEPKTYDVRWPEIRNLDEVQKATVAGLWADINAKFGATVVTAAEIRDLVLGLEPLVESEAPIVDVPAKVLPLVAAKRRLKFQKQSRLLGKAAIPVQTVEKLREAIRAENLTEVARILGVAA